MAESPSPPIQGARHASCVLSHATDTAIRGLTQQVHPRINFLLATMVQASDEVFHFFLSFSLIFIMFAVVAHFQFGASNSEFATLKRSFLSQFQMITAGIEGWGDESTDFIGYVLLVYVVQGLFMLNFFLAMVLGAYEIVKQKVVDQLTEQSIMADAFDAFVVVTRKQRHGWPSHTKILRELARKPASENVTRDELKTILKGEGATEAFVVRYQGFDFLKENLQDDQATAKVQQREQQVIDNAMLAYVEKLEREVREARTMQGVLESYAASARMAQAASLSAASTNHAVRINGLRIRQLNGVL